MFGDLFKKYFVDTYGQDCYDEFIARYGIVKAKMDQEKDQYIGAPGVEGETFTVRIDRDWFVDTTSGDGDFTIKYVEDDS